MPSTPDLSERASVRFPLLRARSPVPLSLYGEMARRCSVLKTVWYSIRFRGVVLVGRGSRIRAHRSARVHLARRSVLMFGLAHDRPAGAVLRMRPRSSLRIDGRVQIMRACHVEVGYDASLAIGADTFLNEQSSIMCCCSTEIGAGCAISWGVRILDTDIHRTGPGAASPHAPIWIGSGCWIGADALVLKGSSLGAGAIVAAGAVVASTVPPKTLVAGVPARVVRENVTWDL
jgi:acetyltransferase-like isoleucine patch superfamily enzyme